MINNLFRISLLLLCTLSARSGAGETKKNPFELLICDYVKFELLKVNKSGEVTWKYKPKSKVWDFVLTEDNHIITKHFEVHCMDFQNKLKWSGKGAHAFILSKDRKVTWSYKDHKTITAASRVWAIE